MQTRNRILDDLARVATSAMGVATGMREEIEARLRDQFEAILARMDVVPREEFEVVKEMAARARDEQERMSERLTMIESKLEAKSAQPADMASPDEPGHSAP